MSATDADVRDYVARLSDDDLARMLREVKARERTVSDRILTAARRELHDRADEAAR